MEQHYNGYQNDFIGKDKVVEFPQLSNELLENIAPVKDAEEDVLKYQNYSVVQHAERRLPIFTASNIDGSRFQKVARHELFKGGQDRWVKDKRIAYEHQWGSELYSAPKSDFDRGHMTKREDVQWGNDVEEASEGARSTFYYTNSVPQRKEVNRAIWLSIENYLLHDEAASNELRISVFTGPVLSQEDPVFVTTVRNTEVQIPTLFWKVIYYPTQYGELARVGFLVGQKHVLEREGIVSKTRSISEGDQLFMDFEQSETYQVEIGLIDELTGMKFAPALDIFKDDRPSKLILEEVHVRSADGTEVEKMIYGLSI